MGAVRIPKEDECSDLTVRGSLNAIYGTMIALKL
jgi:hypothetical protein